MLDYGIIGNCITCALVKKDASIEWLCYPNFDSPAIFAKILDTKKGGSLEISPLGNYTITQKYIPNTAILETTFESESAGFKVYDFFPRYKKLLSGKHEKLIKENKLIRIIRPTKGTPKIHVKYDPKPNYALDSCELTETNNSLLCNHKSRKFSLASNIPLASITKQVPITLSSTKYLLVGENNINPTLKKCIQLLNATKKYWQHWCSTLILPEKNREIIIRSAITLKLHTFSKTGAIIAAATTSIPEEIGKDRNFDYRYCWVRDAAYCVDALKKIGRDYESKKLMKFIINKAYRDDYIPIMYDIHGNTKLKEQTLNHLSGFKNTKPVRIGNAAYSQTQNDIYGAILDIIYLYYAYYEYETKMSKKYWRFITYIVNQIKFNWEKRDNGIWEFRGRYEHFTFSKLMCYVGVDRAIKLAQHFERDDLIEDWLPLREDIKSDILKNAYNKEVNAFTIYYGSKSLDASLLLMAYHDFLPKDDPRLINTIKAIYTDLRTDYLTQRYTLKDDFGQSGMAFIICSFWLVDALYYIGEEKKAREIYEKLIKHANHLDLFSETIDIKTKKLTGNFPQVYTHMALINSSILLSEWSAKRKKIDWSAIPKRNKWF